MVTDIHACLVLAGVDESHLHTGLLEVQHD